MLQCAANQGFLPLADTAGMGLIRHFLCLLPTLLTACVCMQANQSSFPKMIHPFFSGFEFLFLCFHSMSWSLQEWQCKVGIKHLTSARAHGLHRIPSVSQLLFRSCCNLRYRWIILFDFRGVAKLLLGTAGTEEQCILFKQPKTLLYDINKIVDLYPAKGGVCLALLAQTPGCSSGVRMPAHRVSENTTSQLFHSKGMTLWCSLLQSPQQCYLTPNNQPQKHF